MATGARAEKLSTRFGKNYAVVKKGTDTLNVREKKNTKSDIVTPVSYTHLRIQTGSYTNKDGQRVYTTDVVVENQEFAESKAASANNAGGYQQAAPSRPCLLYTSRCV